MSACVTFALEIKTLILLIIYLSYNSFNLETKSMQRRGIRRLSVNTPSTYVGLVRKTSYYTGLYWWHRCYRKIRADSTTLRSMSFDLFRCVAIIFVTASPARACARESRSTRVRSSMRVD